MAKMMIKCVCEICGKPYASVDEAKSCEKVCKSKRTKAANASAKRQALLLELDGIKNSATSVEELFDMASSVLKKSLGQHFIFKLSSYSLSRSKTMTLDVKLMTTSRTPKGPAKCGMGDNWCTSLYDIPAILYYLGIDWNVGYDRTGTVVGEVTMNLTNYPKIFETIGKEAKHREVIQKQIDEIRKQYKAEIDSDVSIALVIKKREKLVEQLREINSQISESNRTYKALSSSYDEECMSKINDVRNLCVESEKNSMFLPNFT